MLCTDTDEASFFERVLPPTLADSASLDLPNRSVFASASRNAVGWQDEFGTDESLRLCVRIVVDGAFPFWNTRGGKPPKNLVGTVISNRPAPPAQLAFRRSLYQSMLDGGGIEKVRRPAVTCAIFEVEKGDTFRPIYDARPVNEYLADRPFSLPKWSDILASTTASCFGCVLDLKHGFFQFALRKDVRRFFCFEVDGVTYQMNVTPQGVKQSPFWFTTGMKGPLKRLREHADALFVAGFYDDVLLLSQTEEGLVRLVTYARSLSQPAQVSTLPLSAVLLPWLDR